MVKLILPFPPSVNGYWRHVAKGQFVRAIISAAGRKYKAAAALTAKKQYGQAKAICDPVEVWIVFHQPDKRARDLDNRLKALFDSITEAGVWLDDNLVHSMHVKWGEKVKKGKAVVWIEKYTEGSDGKDNTL